MSQVPYHYATSAAPFKLDAIGTKNKKKLLYNLYWNFLKNMICIKKQNFVENPSKHFANNLKYKLTSVETTDI